MENSCLAQETLLTFWKMEGFQRIMQSDCDFENS